MEGFAIGEVRTGSTYEVERAAARARLASIAEHRRVDLGGGLVLVFETRETVRTALEELLRAERVGDEERIATESAAFAELIGGRHELVATLYLDVADPVELADRLTELPGIANAVSLGVAGDRVSAQADPADDPSGAFTLRFGLSIEQCGALLDGAAVAVNVNHPGCLGSASLSAEQIRAVSADLQRDGR